MLNNLTDIVKLTLLRAAREILSLISCDSTNSLSVSSTGKNNTHI